MSKTLIQKLAAINHIMKLYPIKNLDRRERKHGEVIQLYREIVKVRADCRATKLL